MAASKRSPRAGNFSHRSIITDDIRRAVGLGYRRKTRLFGSDKPPSVNLDGASFICVKGEEDRSGKPGAASRSWRARHAVEGAGESSLRVGWGREHGLERAGVLWLREAS
jgi:hypothetical protein